MVSSMKLALLFAAGLGGAAALCPFCGGGMQTAGAQPAPAAVQAPDTATVRLHISRMTCGSCPATARLALKRLPGVYSAAVTLNDSLGVACYARTRVTAAYSARSGPRSAHRSSSAFTVTVTVLALIASAAHAGLSRMPSDGYNTPAASGIAIRL